ncbi:MULTISPECIES: septal ring lytic transglycosylase RlpA family protein [Comamonas]|uniref:septal ring lytic transglycosylase RlpA family protein n=1 Tax=Comamonas TaxID=283 RepID=UPI00351CF8B0
MTLFISGCAPLPTTPEGAATATPTQAGAPIPEGPNARPSRWGWWSHDRKGAEALAKAAPKPPKLSDKPDPAAQTAPDARDSDQKGLASWYGPGFHGKLTANGERFNSGELTAAHRSLAFGTRVCVRSSVTGKTVVVRINDRGPFAKNRVIDLSQGAAEQLGMVGLGIKPVELWALADDESQCPGEDDDLDGQLEARLSDLSPDARRAVEAHRQAHGESTSTVAKQVSKKKK